MRLLASAYLVISDYPSVLKLESKAAIYKPSVVNDNILIFGCARILSGDYPQAASFLKTQLVKGKIKERDIDWINWFYGFSHILNGSFLLAEPEFISLSVYSNDALIIGLSAYFLSAYLAKYSQKPENCLTASESGKNRVKNAITSIEKWKIEAEKRSSDVHIAIIRKYIDEAGFWLFLEKEQETQKTAELSAVMEEKPAAKQIFSDIPQPKKKLVEEIKTVDVEPPQKPVFDAEKPQPEKINYNSHIIPDRMYKEQEKKL
nr:hypothetical protein [uncultured bacterium]